MGQISVNNQDFVRLGISQVNITPEQPVIMSGYDARKTPSTGVHDSLFASALFFSGKQNKALHISADLKRFWTGETEGPIFFSFTGFTAARKHIASIMQAKRCFVVCGLTKKESQCNRAVI